jgi:hypothetical protein
MCYILHISFASFFPLQLGNFLLVAVFLALDVEIFLFQLTSSWWLFVVFLIGSLLNILFLCFILFRPLSSTDWYQNSVKYTRFAIKTPHSNPVLQFEQQSYVLLKRTLNIKLNSCNHAFIVVSTRFNRSSGIFLVFSSLFFVITYNIFLHP